MDTNSTKYKFAKVVSRVFDVPIGGGILLLYMWNDFNKNVSMSIYTLVAAVSILIILPIFIILVLIRYKFVDNWELTKKESRIYVYFLMTFVLTISLIFAQLSQLPLIVSQYLILGLFIVIVFGFINSFTKYKISVHMGVWTSLIVILILNESIYWLLLSPILVLIGYSRYVIKNHTFTELFLGTSVMTIIIILYEAFSKTVF